jgi:hypothetical protein
LRKKDITMHSRGRLVMAAALAAVVSSLFVGATPAGAAPPPPGVVNATLAPGSKASAGGAYYAFGAQPSATITQQVIVANPSKTAVTAHVDAVDAVTNNKTGVSFPPPGTAPTAVGRWITVSTPVVTLQPESQQTVSFTVRVPAGTKSGVHLGGIAVYSPAQQQTTPSTLSSKTASFDLKLQPRRVLSVEVTVPGPKAPALAVTGAHAIATADGVALVVQMANNGNDYARGTGTIAVPDTKLNQQFKMDTFVPGTSINYQLDWTHDVVPGTHPISVVLKYGGRQLNWNGTVVINGATAAQLRSQLAPATSAKHSSGFPVALLVVGLVLALLCVAAAIVLRRRRRAQSVAVTPAADDQLAA